MIVGALPLVLQIALNDTHGNDRNAVESDIADNLYSRFVYIVTSVSLNNTKNFKNMNVKLKFLSLFLDRL